jgi:ATP-dependent RNA helicase RhlE
VFARTKHGADRIAKDLKKAGVRSDAIHGDKTQVSRQRALTDFKSGKLRVLVATDIAARGIDVDNLTHIINFDLPNVPETYVHRIGRTGRAGASGKALSFCDGLERDYLKDINKLINQKIPAVFEHPYAQTTHAPEAEKPRNAAPPRGDKKFGPPRRRNFQTAPKG